MTPELLRDGSIEVLGQIARASNATLLVRLHAQDDAALAICKPRSGEAPLWDFPTGVLHRHEVAAYELSRLLGFPNIPATILREDTPFGPAALQVFVEHDPERHARTLGPDFEPALRQIALFDVVANNADRKAGHVLVDADERLWAIDHGICFAPSLKLRTVLWDFAGQPFTDAERAALDVLDTQLGSATPLDDLLEERARIALAGRVRALRTAPHFPEPPRRRPGVPWPPV